MMPISARISSARLTNVISVVWRMKPLATYQLGQREATEPPERRKEGVAWQIYLA